MYLETFSNFFYLNWGSNWIWTYELGSGGSGLGFSSQLDRTLSVGFRFGQKVPESGPNRTVASLAQGEENKVFKLVCSLYGLKQVGRVWNKTFANTIQRKLGFEMIHSDVGVYILCHWQGGIMKIILILYVDDLLLLGEDQSEIEDIKHQLGNLYQMKDLGPTSEYLGIKITRDYKQQTIWIDQQVYIKTQ